MTHRWNRCALARYVGGIYSWKSFGLNRIAGAEKYNNTSFLRSIGTSNALLWHRHSVLLEPPRQSGMCGGLIWNALVMEVDTTHERSLAFGNLWALLNKLDT